MFDKHRGYLWIAFFAPSGMEPRHLGETERHVTTHMETLLDRRHNIPLELGKALFWRHCVLIELKVATKLWWSWERRFSGATVS